MSSSNPLCANYDGAQGGIQGEWRVSGNTLLAINIQRSHTRNWQLPQGEWTPDCCCYFLFQSFNLVSYQLTMVAPALATDKSHIVELIRTSSSHRSPGAVWETSDFLLLLHYVTSLRGLTRDLQTKQINPRLGRQKWWNVRLFFLLCQ